MNKGPGLFSDFGKKARDLLNKDYNSEQKFSVSSNQSGVGVVSSLSKKGGLCAGNIATQYKASGAVVDVKLDTDSNISGTVSYTNLLPALKIISSYHLRNYEKVEVQYFHEHAAISAAVVGMNKLPAVDFSATIGTPSIAFGAETTYVAATREFTKYNAGVSFVKPDSNASVILADKGDSLKVAYMQYLDKLNRGAAVGEISRKFSTNENTLTVGCLYAVDPHTLIKAKLNNHGDLGALIQHEIRPMSFLTLSGAFDTKALEKTPKFGLSLALKP